MPAATRSFNRYELVVISIASIIFLGCIISPPSLMDDVDAVQASIARTMLQTGDWVTPQLDGVKYMEKPPLKYWIIAVFFKLFGVHDYVARLPLAISAVLLCWLTLRIGVWAFGMLAGFYSGIVLSSCIGLFLFTRVLIPDVQLTFTVAFAIWSLMRAVDEEEARPRLWGLLFWVSVALGILLKGLIGALFPFGSGLFYLLLTKRFLIRETWRRLVPFSGPVMFLLIAAPWHILATIRNPPYFYFGLHSGPGEYHGFFWFYFFNEHILRFLNRRYPRDYNTVPRLYFWLLQLLWLFPWSAYVPALFRLDYRGSDRGSCMRLMALCWIGFLMLFFTFSSTQEYYSMPAYPAMALLLGCAIASDQPAVAKWRKRGSGILLLACTLGSGAIVFILARVWRVPTPGDISQALVQKPRGSNAYTLSLGHMGDLTLGSFAYLRTPLVIAFIAFSIGLLGLLFLKAGRPFFWVAVMMIVFFHAARLAMVTFDPYMSSRRLAEALLKSTPGILIVDGQYYTFSSVFFYADKQAFMHNGRVNNLEYGSNAPGAPAVFLDDSGLIRIWKQRQRVYLLVEEPSLPRIMQMVGPSNFTVVKQSGGKYLLTNLPLNAFASYNPVISLQLLPEELSFRAADKQNPISAAQLLLRCTR